MSATTTGRTKAALRTFFFWTFKPLFAGGIHFDIFYPNLKFLSRIMRTDLAKHLFAPPIGVPKSIIRTLAQNFQCRRCRWEQIGLTSSQCQQAAILDFAELIAVGYTMRIIHSAWCQSRGHDGGYGIGLNIILKAGGGRSYLGSDPWCCPAATLEKLQTWFGDSSVSNHLSRRQCGSALIPTSDTRQRR